MLNWTDERISEHTLSMEATAEEYLIYICVYVYVKETNNSIYVYNI